MLYSFKNPEPLGFSLNPRGSGRLLRATSFRLAVLQTLLFLAAFALAGLIALWVVRRDEAQAVDAELTQQMADLQTVYGQGGGRGAKGHHRGAPTRS